VSDAPPAIARRASIIGLVLGVASALLAVVWTVGIVLGLAALAVCWQAAQRAKGRDNRTIGFAIGGLTAGAFGVLLGIASAAFGGTTDTADPVIIDGIETSTPDAEHQPPHDLDPGTTCTVDLDGLRAEGTLTNHTDRTVRYRMRVVWDDSGAELAEATAVFDSVAPGASQPFTVVSPKTGTAATTCRIAAIDRDER
jgi:hypothetical protein